MHLAIDNGTAVGVNGLAANGAAVIARQEYKASGNLARLRRPADWSGKLLDWLVSQVPDGHEADNDMWMFLHPVSMPELENLATRCPTWWTFSVPSSVSP